jgi:hypothetical protein
MPRHVKLTDGENAVTQDSLRENRDVVRAKLSDMGVTTGTPTMDSALEKFGSVTLPSTGHLYVSEFRFGVFTDDEIQSLVLALDADRDPSVWNLSLPGGRAGHETTQFLYAEVARESADRGLGDAED